MVIFKWNNKFQKGELYLVSKKIVVSFRFNVNKAVKFHISTLKYITIFLKNINNMNLKKI